MTHPDLIVCDEPVSALDASVQAQILNLLRQVQEDFGPAYLFISHDLAVVGFMCPHILVMYLGRFVEEGPRERLLREPAHPYTRALLASVPSFEDLRDGKSPVRAPQQNIRGELPSPLDPPSGCRFHPRCPQATERCREEAPQWKELEPGWRARPAAVGWSPARAAECPLPLHLPPLKYVLCGKTERCLPRRPCLTACPPAGDAGERVFARTR